MDIAIQLIVDVEVALVLQRGAASGAPETVNMQVLVLDPDKDTTVQRRRGHQGRFVRDGCQAF